MCGKNEYGSVLCTTSTTDPIDVFITNISKAPTPTHQRPLLMDSYNDITLEGTSVGRTRNDRKIVSITKIATTKRNVMRESQITPVLYYPHDSTTSMGRGTACWSSTSRWRLVQSTGILLYTKIVKPCFAPVSFVFLERNGAVSRE